MTEPISVVMPAFRAGATVAASVSSLLAQEHRAWELLLVADDGADYEAVLGRAGIADPRIRHLSTGRVGSGSSAARNEGLDAARTHWVAMLDADDRFAPGKLAALAAALPAHPLVSTALRVTDAAGATLRHVGTGPDRDLPAAGYKRVNISMDSMIGFDRRAGDPRYDESLPCLTDLDFVMRLFAAVPACRHLGAPLHDYVKQEVSISNGPGVAARMVATKRLLLGRLEAGDYGFAAPGAAAGFIGFLGRSLEAEESYEAALAARPGLLFEDHLEGFLGAGDS